MQQDIFPPPKRLIRLPQVMTRVGMSRSWLYAAVAAHKFPAPAKIGRASGWDADAVDAWIASHLSAAA